MLSTLSLLKPVQDTKTIYLECKFDWVNLGFNLISGRVATPCQALLEVFAMLVTGGSTQAHNMKLNLDVNIRKPGPSSHPNCTTTIITGVRTLSFKLLQWQFPREDDFLCGTLLRECLAQRLEFYAGLTSLRLFLWIKM